MKTRTVFFIAAALLAALPESLHAQAYCALRDPVSTIQTFAPESSGHQSIIKVVGGSARKEVSQRLPFTIHFNELGKHTLYVVLKDEKPEGLLHARSEKGKWGLVEIVWYFDLDLNVQGFTYQRCRDRSKSALQSPEFMAQLKGKGFQEIRAMLDESGESIVPGKVKVEPEAVPLAITTLRSALKTMTVTDVVWGEQLKEMNGEVNPLEAVAESRADQNAFPKQHKLVPVKDIYTDEVIATLNTIQQEEEWIIDRETVEVNRAIDRADNPLGLLIQTQCTADEELVVVGWTVDSEGKISKVTSLSKWPSDDVKEAFDNLESLTLDQIGHCSTAGQLAAAEVLAITKAHLGP